jgi:hypothetical protein
MKRALSDKPAKLLLQSLAMEPQWLTLNSNGDLLRCYDLRVDGSADIVVGYLYELNGAPLNVLAHEVNLDDLDQVYPISQGGGHVPLQQKHGRHISLAELAWLVLNVPVDRLPPNSPSQVSEAVQSAYRAGLLPPYRLMEMLSAVPAAWFAIEAEYRHFHRGLLDASPNVADSMLRLAELAVLHAVYTRR